LWEARRHFQVQYAAVSSCDHITWSVVANSPTCSTVSTPPTSTFSFLRTDINHDGAVSMQDIFDFPAAWFAGC
jgi:hypothetical protein